MVHIGRLRRAGTPRERRDLVRIAQVVLIGSAIAALAACSSSSHSSNNVSSTSGTTAGASQTKIENVEVIGKIDADSGADGTFTGKDDWPAVAPSDIHISAGATVVLTIKEYDDMVTALPDGSSFNNVMGGTETVDGKQVTSVGNDQIAHTMTISSLGINIPLPKAPEGGFTTVTFTFKAPASGTYEWRCMTPCGDGPMGMGGAMQTDAWMRGHMIVA